MDAMIFPGLVRALMTLEPMHIVSAVYWIGSGVGAVLLLEPRNITSIDNTAGKKKDDSLFRTLFYFVSGGFLLPMAIGSFILGAAIPAFYSFVSKVENSKVSDPPL